MYIAYIQLTRFIKIYMFNIVAQLIFLFSVGRILVYIISRSAPRPSHAYMWYPKPNTKANIIYSNVSICAGLLLCLYYSFTWLK